MGITRRYSLSARSIPMHLYFYLHLPVSLSPQAGCPSRCKGARIACDESASSERDSLPSEFIFLYFAKSSTHLVSTAVHTAPNKLFGESGLENEPTAPGAEQAHTTRRDLKQRIHTATRNPRSRGRTLRRSLKTSSRLSVARKLSDTRKIVCVVRTHL